jgi:hypothetical protein
VLAYVQLRAFLSPSCLRVETKEAKLPVCVGTMSMFGNRALRGVFGRKRREITGYWRKLHNEELHNLYSSHIIKMIKSRRIT